MPRFIALVIAGCIGAILGSIFRPGLPEIIIVAVALGGLVAGVQSLTKKRPPVTV